MYFRQVMPFATFGAELRSRFCLPTPKEAKHRLFSDRSWCRRLLLTVADGLLALPAVCEVRSPSQQRGLSPAFGPAIFRVVI